MSKPKTDESTTAGVARILMRRFGGYEFTGSDAALLENATVNPRAAQFVQAAEEVVQFLKPGEVKD